MTRIRVQVDGFRDGRSIRTRTAKGTFAFTGGAGSQRGFTDRNRILAGEAQRAIVKQLESHIVRGTVSTGRLAKVTADASNITWDRHGFGVGDPGFLDKSQAKYWRTIDEGTGFWSHAFVGSTFYALKGKAFGASVAYFNGQVSIAGPKFTGPGRASGGLANFISSDVASKILGTDRAGSVIQVVIGRDIQAKHYYREGFRASGVIEKGVRSAFQGIEEIFRAL